MVMAVIKNLIGEEGIVDLVTMGSLPQSESLGVQTHSLCP